MSLYLKYRPHDFDNLVGQDFINQTLKKAIADDKLVGAYLFCGPRGTGKTSTARIFAKTINCKNQSNGNPCLNCDICKDFLEEKLIDIIEIDAASHTGVDNIREIIEKSKFRPSRTKYKVYIIDEVHMLSKGAFNALLKILEEPPEFVKFILATTELHKVPDTIISRCQRYDFKRIDDESVKSRLKYIADTEKITIDNDSIDYIVKNSRGGLRDAISLFEQLMSDNKIDYKSVVENLGITEQELLEGFLFKLLQKDTSILNDLQQIIESGKNIKLFFKDLLFYIKDTIISEISTGKDVNNLIHIIDILDETYSKTKHSFDEYLTFTVGVLKILGDYKEEQTHQKKTASKPKKTVNKKLDKTTIHVNPTPEIEFQNISHDDVGEIFGNSDNSDIISSLPVTKTKISETNSGYNGASFHTEGFISELKKLGAKGAITMSIRGAKSSLDDTALHLKFPTNFAKKSVDNPDTIVLLHKALEGLNLGERDIKLS